MVVMFYYGKLGIIFVKYFVHILLYVDKFHHKRLTGLLFMNVLHKNPVHLQGIKLTKVVQ